ncbi:tetratricopeptide repeat protein [Psychroserpens sp. SPM9]|uniref:tetratricopeptide repeat protein n=1 Tax=Psychroserpens sp. SPM9 TaxID=2975598 RepID=UPI0021A3CD73|nr:tetratricopeptide repeat protein [Psychroserpens sp. SPM9]MDG5490884.1 tetratricopeptide repeat protein [Psychroserpens sp. SPM9]
MRITGILVLMLLTNFGFAQDKDKEKAQQVSLQKAKDYVYQGNELAEADNYIYAEKEYRKAISKAPSVVAGAYNLGNTYYEKGNYEEALYRHTQAAEQASSKSEKHKAYHNIGNILMKEELCKEAVEAYKNALRNDPSDDETRYNLAIAKECAAQQQQEKDKEEDKKDEDKEDEDKKEDKKEDEKKEDPKDQGDQDKKEGDDQKDDEGKPKDDKDQGKGDKKEDQKQKGEPKPKEGQLSPQQIKNLLEAMNNQEQKVQQKINAEKQKGAKVKPEKDW